MNKAQLTTQKARKAKQSPTLSACVCGQLVAHGRLALGAKMQAVGGRQPAVPRVAVDLGALDDLVLAWVCTEWHARNAGTANEGAVNGQALCRDVKRQLLEGDAQSALAALQRAAPDVLQVRFARSCAVLIGVVADFGTIPSPWTYSA